MDCCGDKTQRAKKENQEKDAEENMKGGNRMANSNNKTLLWVVIGILVVATIFLTFKASSIGTGAASATASAAKAAASNAMVGGC